MLRATKRTSHDSTLAFTISVICLVGVRLNRTLDDHISLNRTRLVALAHSLKLSPVLAALTFGFFVRYRRVVGTIELRVCDTPLSVDRAAALACYLQALCKYLLERNEPDPVEDDYLVYNYNRFQACRFGLDGVIVHPKSYEQISLREDILATVRRIQPQAEALGCAVALEHIYQTTHEGSDASYLRREYLDRGSVEGMVDSAMQRFRHRNAISAST